LRRRGLVAEQKGNLIIKRNKSKWMVTPLPETFQYNKKRVTKKREVKNEGAYEVAQHLYDSVMVWHDNFNPIGEWLQNWALDIDKLIRIDKQDPELIKAVITNMSKDKGSDRFAWRRVILSGKKLRMQFPKLSPQYAPKKPRKEYREYDKPLSKEMQDYMSAPLDEYEKSLLEDA